MARRSPRLDVVAPCPVPWEEMSGDDRVRFCGRCAQHVYDVAQLSVDQVMALVLRHEGHVCVQLQQRADGTVITRDCLHAVRRARESLVATAVGVVVAAVGFWAGMRRLQLLLAPPADPDVVCPRPPPPPKERTDWIRWAHDEQGWRGGDASGMGKKPPRQDPSPPRTRGRIKMPIE